MRSTKKTRSPSVLTPNAKSFGLFSNYHTHREGVEQASTSSGRMGSHSFWPIPYVVKKAALCYGLLLRETPLLSQFLTLKSGVFI